MTTKVVQILCITTNQPDTKSNPATQQHTIVNIQLNIVTCPTRLEKFIRDDVIAPFLLLSVVIVTAHLPLGSAYFN